MAEACDRCLHELAAAAAVGFAVGGDHVLVGGPGGFDFDVLIACEQGLEPEVWLVGEQVTAGVPHISGFAFAAVGFRHPRKPTVGLVDLRAYVVPGVS